MIEICPKCDGIGEIEIENLNGPAGISQWIECDTCPGAEVVRLEKSEIIVFRHIKSGIIIIEHDRYEMEIKSDDVCLLVDALDHHDLILESKKKILESRKKRHANDEKDPYDVPCSCTNNTTCPSCRA